MLSIDHNQCTGCGACLEVCPHSALYLLEGKAVVDAALCRECALCVAACPEGAIRPVETSAKDAPLPAVQSAPQVIPVKTRPAPLAAPLRSHILPTVGAALVWTAREIVPALADYLVNRLARGTASSQRRERCRNGKGGRRRRRRWRGA